MRSLFTILTIIIAGNFLLKAQDFKNCAQDKMQEFNIEGQTYQLVLNGSDKGKVYFSFFNPFIYRVGICSNNIQKYKIDLYDIQKKLLFSSTCENFTKELDLSFKSNIAGYFEITCIDPGVENPAFQIVIGFKEKKDQQSKKE